jgi:plastocyanin
MTFVQGGTSVHWLKRAIVASFFFLSVLPTQATPPPFEIVIDGGSPYYYPASAKVPAGAPIRWDNPTGSPHTITHDGCVDGGLCAFDSGVVSPNGSYTAPGLAPGRYPYQCRLHPIMRGVLTIVEPADTSPQT